MLEPVSRRSQEVFETIAIFYRFVTGTIWDKIATGGDDVCDFVFGNPHEMPLKEFTAALQHWLVPQNHEWHAYKNNERKSREVVAASLRKSRGLPYIDEDIFLTNGAFAAIAVALASVVDAGDEVIYISPPWFFYGAIIVSSGAKAVSVNLDEASFDLDIASIQAAITPRTRAIIINSPHNPTGKIYPAETLAALANVLNEAGRANGRTIYLLSDESYSRIIFDGRAYPSPATFYPNSFVLYTYGKVLLTPGERLGYIALSPNMSGREALRDAIFTMQFAMGYAFPNALLQHAIAELDVLSIDIPHLQRKRDHMVSALREIGYSVQLPEGTFYLVVKSPLEDEALFLDLLAEYNVLVLPGTVMQMPGFFRVSLTANDEMIQRALPRFAAAFERARSLAKV